MWNVITHNFFRPPYVNKNVLCHINYSDRYIACLLYKVLIDMWNGLGGFMHLNRQNVMLAGSCACSTSCKLPTIAPHIIANFTGFVRICYMSLSSDLCDVFLRIYMTAFAQTGLNFVFYLHFDMWGCAGWGDKEPRTMTPIPGRLIP